MSVTEKRRAQEQYLKDYVEGGVKLFWQRHMMYFGAFVLSEAYYDKTMGVICYLAVLLSEAFDHLVSRRIMARTDSNPSYTKRFYYLIHAGTLLNALAISSFVVSAARWEGEIPHLTPIVLLLAAALFAAMNTHQIVSALALRLGVYGAAFTAIALQNVLMTRAPISSIHWLHFFTVIFVMYFIVDYSLFFLKTYRRNLSQMDQLRREHSRAIQAYHAKSEFLSIVSHELRTPLTSIKGALNLVCSGKMGDLPPNMSHMLGIADKNAERLAALIDDLLDFQAIEAGKLGMTFKAIDLNRLVRDSMDATGSYLREKRVRMIYKGYRHPLVVSADAKRLTQVMVNVLSNAIKFSKEDGLVEVSIDVAEAGARISVRDFGRGIPPGCEEQVFEAFSQIGSSNIRSVNGTGLGMSVSRQIMREHDGDIAYESELGVGTVFRLTLPLSEEQVDQAPTANCDFNRAASSSSAHPAVSQTAA